MMMDCNFSIVLFGLKKHKRISNKYNNSYTGNVELLIESIEYNSFIEELKRSGNSCYSTEKG